MDNIFPTTAQLRQIPYFNASDIPRLEAALPAIAQIFIQHRKQLSWAVAYLHRHHDIEENSLWFQEQDGTTDICSLRNIEQLNIAELNAQAYCLLGGHFRGYEYAYSNAMSPELNLAFLDALKDYLLQSDLNGVAGIVPRRDYLAFETLNQSGTFTRGQTSADLDREQQGLTTEWHFDATQDGIKIVEQKRCITKNNGEHQVVDKGK